MPTDSALLYQLRALWKPPPELAEPAEDSADTEPTRATKAAADIDLAAIRVWLDAPPKPAPPPWCPRYQHPVAWRSVYGPHLICGNCHPPVAPEIVAEWIDYRSRCG